MNSLPRLCEWNMAREQERAFAAPKKMAGVACDKCGSEMFYDDPHSVLACSPPKKSVSCQCGHRGYKTL